MSRSFLQGNVDDIVKKLSTDEKISLLGAPDWWNTQRIDRLAVPSLRLSDGPNGVRGSSHFLSSPAQCIPCATSLASTFDKDLVKQVGEFLAKEAKLKAAPVLLAPTCNIQRTPLGGRAFESFSEDPHLSGMMAASYVRGLQSKGVSATIKHFVANDQEHERTAADSVVSERALREVYLYPFMLAQRDAAPWAFMTAYGRIDDIHCSENPRLLEDILRKEWGFDGPVISDWFGTYSTSEAIKAGLDLEMPGPPRWRTPTLINHLLSAQKLVPSDLDLRSSKILKFVQKVAKASPDVVYGDGIERSEDTPASREFNRRVASEGIVLLKNDDDALPLLKSTKKLAIIGPNAKGRVISGGGSAYLKPSYVITPFSGIQSAAPKDTVIDFAVGCYAHKFLPTLEDKLVTPDGKPGWLCIFYDQDEHGTPQNEVARYVLQDTRVKLNDFLPPGLGAKWSIKLTGSLTVDRTAPFELGLTVAGRAKLFINGELTIDNWTKQRPGEFFYGQGTVEEKATVELVAGKAVDVLVEYTNTPPPTAGERDNSQPALMLGVRLGGAEKIDADAAIEEAARLASKSDAVVIVAGLNHEWEAEGFDRPSLDLPGRQAELIRRVAKANPKTIVVVQAGSAVDLSWSEDVAAVLQAWYLGNETGNAIADVLFGAVNPSGRLPLTLPKREEDIPAFLNTKSENGKIHYREDIYVGYKWYQSRKIVPQYPFGFGLSYTSFSFERIVLSPVKTGNDASSFGLDVSITVKNIGNVSGSEVVQLYLELAPSKVQHPSLQLRAFEKIRGLSPGLSETVTLHLDKYAVSFWDEPKELWKVEKGAYGIFVGPSSAELPLRASFKLDRGYEWSGL